MKLLALPLALFLAVQDEKIPFKFTPKQGDKVAHSQKMDFKMNCTVETDGASQEIEVEVRQTVKKTTEYAEVTDGLVTRMIVDCTESFGERKQPPTMEWTRIDDAMHGRKVTVFMKDGQVAREGADGLKEKDLKDLNLKTMEGKILPPKSLAVGETWEIKGDDVRGFLGGHQEIKDATLKMKLTEVKEIDKRRCAVITATADIAGMAPNEVDINAKLDLEIIIWIERGYVLSVKGKGKITMKAENERFTLNGEGPITIEMTSKVE